MSYVTPKRVILTTLAVVVFIALCVVGAAGCKGYNRYQRRADANNHVQIVRIQTKQAYQEAKRVKARNGVVFAQAQQRVIEAEGIRRAQDKISATLTPLYLQHEAIQAQRAWAQSPNNSVIYIPSGDNAVPMVNDVSTAKPVTARPR